MHRRSISTVSVLLLVVVALMGCATSKEALLAHGDATMLGIWNQSAAGHRTLDEARDTLRRPLIATEGAANPIDPTAYTRTARNEIERLFHRLPNPDLVMYVFPHLAGTESVPVPGYSTVFPFYAHVQYALPGERTDDL